MTRHSGRACSTCHRFTQSISLGVHLGCWSSLEISSLSSLLFCFSGFVTQLHDQPTIEAHQPLNTNHENVAGILHRPHETPSGVHIPHVAHYEKFSCAFSLWDWKDRTYGGRVLGVVSRQDLYMVSSYLDLDREHGHGVS